MFRPARRDGHVVNTASEAGILAGSSGFLYAMSKYAVVGLSESLRNEVGPLGIGISVLSPGPVATTIMQNTMAVRPETAPAHSTRVSKILSTSHEWLITQGRSPDDVGELVLDAVRENRLYMFTCDEMGPDVSARTEAILAAMKHDQTYLDERGLPAR